MGLLIKYVTVKDTAHVICSIFLYAQCSGINDSAFVRIVHDWAGTTFQGSAGRYSKDAVFPSRYW